MADTNGYVQLTRRVIDGQFEGLIAQLVHQSGFVGAGRKFGGTGLLKDVPVERRREVAVQFRKSCGGICAIELIDAGYLKGRGFKARYLYAEQRCDADNQHGVVYRLHGDGRGETVSVHGDGRLGVPDETGVPSRLAEFRSGFGLRDCFFLCTTAD